MRAVCAAVLFLTTGQMVHAQDATAGSTQKVRFDTIDKNNDNLITPDEMTAWRAAKFKTRDMDADGIITREELLTEATDGARAMTWDESTAFIWTYDTNRDLMVTYDEVIDAIEQSNFFEIIDYDRSGTITREEARSWLDVSMDEPAPASEPITSAASLASGGLY